MLNPSAVRRADAVARPLTWHACCAGLRLQLAAKLWSGWRVRPSGETLATDSRDSAPQRHAQHDGHYGNGASIVLSLCTSLPVVLRAAITALVQGVWPGSPAYWPRQAAAHDQAASRRCWSHHAVERAHCLRCSCELAVCARGSCYSWLCSLGSSSCCGVHGLTLTPSISAWIGILTEACSVF